MVDDVEEPRAHIRLHKPLIHELVEHIQPLKPDSTTNTLDCKETHMTISNSRFTNSRMHNPVETIEFYMFGTKLGHNLSVYLPDSSCITKFIIRGHVHALQRLLAVCSIL